MIMTWRRIGNKPLSEAVIVVLLTHRGVIRLQNIFHVFQQWKSIFVEVQSIISNSDARSLGISSHYIDLVWAWLRLKIFYQLDVPWLKALDDHKIMSMYIPWVCLLCDFVLGHSCGKLWNSSRKYQEKIHGGYQSHFPQCSVRVELHTLHSMVKPVCNDHLWNYLWFIQ